jgi:carboxymethylenebutenolidase
MDLHLWVPESGSGPGIVLIQEIFGVGAYIRAVGQRLAEAGFVVGAPDVFWRFSPGWASDHDQAGLEASFAKAGQMDAPQSIGDCAAAVSHLGSLPEVTGKVGVMGFCMGGTLAWGVAGTGAPACCVSYYGSGVPSMLDLVDTVSCPTLFHFGNQDPYLPNEGVEALNARIAGKSNFAINVEIAGHAFDNHENAMFWNESAAKSAWSKTMAFLNRELA